MNTDIEWLFEFHITSSLSPAEHCKLADDLHMAAIEWAEARKWGIGGGFRMLNCHEGSKSKHIFGLTATSDNQLIASTDAQGLFESLSANALDHGAKLKGGWRLFDEHDD